MAGTADVREQDSGGDSSGSKASDDYVIRVVDDPADIDAAQWNALLAAQPGATPFMRHEYLAALHASASAVAETGWLPQFLTVFDGAALIAACPLYLKEHSYGEYVFDWAWADAYQRHGLHYYPKLLDAVPFTPVPGPRLLARDATGRRVLLRAMQQLARNAKLSSAHLLFLDDADQQAARAEGWMMRSTVQFHWTQREGTPYADFADLLAGLQRDKRKKIQQERRKVAEAGVTFTEHQGAQITGDDWDFFYRCYTQTYREHRSTPYLTRDFFARMAGTMAEHWLMFIAWQGGAQIAASLICIDPRHGSAFGRYWGAVAHVPCLHFEACYYRPLAWCIEHGYQRFEGGAQGEHKMARGLLPVQTWSAHWLAHPQFAQAVGDFLAREGAGVADYISELNERRPFKSNDES
ncbi:MAG TPA: GNAT family N-acetyltransferase [Burkholderiaceae bacterium]